mmetsp:Transcript_63018/g.142201  ORF Transcript_63018/g.142201 Transcript_63018/m.142201 type:complete len:631 (-) Transcript_63018:310-2202(-)
MAALASEPVPITKLLLRSKEGVRLFNGPLGAARLDDASAVKTVVPDEGFPTGHSNLCQFSPDGSLLAKTCAQGVEIVGTDGGVGSLTITDLLPGRVQKLAFSPKSTFLVTWHKLEAAQDPSEAADRDGNLRVFETATGKRLAAFPLKKMTTMAWPALQWTSDESYVLHMMSNEIRVFESLENGFIGKISTPGLASMSVSPSASLPVKVSVFVPESKGKPAGVKIHQFPQLATGAIASKTFYQAQEISMDWSPNGAAVLVKTHTDVDASGSSYYGSTGLYLLAADGSYEAAVPTAKEGPISDAKWSPTSRGFVVLAGTMPAAATLYDLKAKPVFSFGAAHRSVISFSPHGRFLCLAGFGNLAGDMDFWDVNKQKKMGSNNAHCAVNFGWSPDSRFFMTATCAPRMNVDNGVKLFRYNGVGPILSMDQEQLFECAWCPSKPGHFPDRPQSPERPPPQPKAGAGGGAAKAGAYRPPGARAGGGSGRSLAELAGDSAGAPQAGKVKAGAAARGASHPLGMAPPPKETSSSAKNKAKKEKKKKAAEAAAAAQAEMEKLKVDSGSAGAPVAAAEAPAAPVDKEKRLRKLRKSLKAIDDLKAKIAEDAKYEMNSDQKAKLKTEAAVRAEIAELEAQE